MVSVLAVVGAWFRRGILWMPLVLLGLARPAGAADFSSIVFYYGGAAPVSELSRFDVAVLEPDHDFVPPPRGQGRTRWLAYVSVGEVLASRPYFARMPRQWLAGRNDTWQARIIDQSAPGWSDFFVSRVAAPLWKAGYQGFFLDTLDSYQLLGKDAAMLERQRQGLVRLIRALRRAYPQAMLILNRGFELLPDLHDQVDAVAFESLYRGWSQAQGKYVVVSETDRAWLLGQAQTVREYGLPVVAIDYCPPEDHVCARDTAQRIRVHGIIPYVGDGHLQTVDVDVLP
ncbi:MAG: endo alpha-1,4 polygalactosaminidase [Castellaniella sp.]|nr:endo alpha-1,4 polygalactosaminidase [Castellaniella sp.]